MMRWYLIAGSACLLAEVLLGGWHSAATAAESDETAQKHCFQFVAGRPDTLPIAPMLINTCTGETFMLAKQARGLRGAKSAQYVWRQIPMGEPQPDAVNTRAARSSKCFAYDNRLFCE